MSYTAADRRVRKLSLTVSDPAHTRAAVGLIEEALRLASLPGESDGRRYHFRRVRLGKIRPRESASLIALRLQSEFLRLASGAVQLEDPSAPQSDAIYFRSPLEPLRFALGRLARGLPLDTWFLRSALPGLSHATSRVDAVRHLLELSVELPGSVVNTALVLEEMLARGELALLLPLFDKETAAELMACVSTAVPARAQVRSFAVPSVWAATIRESLRLWGAADIRTLWLASAALLAQVPARLADPDLPAKAQALIAGIASARLADPKSSAKAQPLIAGTAPARLADPNLPAEAQAPSATVDTRENSKQETQSLAAGSGVPQPPQRGHLSHLRDSSARPAAITSSQLPSPISDLDLSPDAQALVAGAAFAQATSATVGTHETSEKGVQSSATELNLAQPLRGGHPSHWRDSIAQHPQSAPIALSRPFSATQAEPELAPVPFSRYAGFYFLLHVLKHLGIEGFLRDHPALLDVNFPWVLLTRLAEHLGLDDEDPHLSFALPVLADKVQERFLVTTPAPWHELFGQRSLGPSVELDVTSLARLWVVAVHRWLWRYGELRISQVARKRGQVRYSRPQVDVTLLLHEVDIRIRRLGLDLDCGWVAWLGLIVRFHYEHSLGDADGTRRN